MEELSQLYKDFIINRLHTSDESFDAEYLEILYSLHNIYVNPSQPANNRFCKSCIIKARDAVRLHYPEK